MAANPEELFQAPKPEQSLKAASAQAIKAPITLDAGTASTTADAAAPAQPLFEAPKPEAAMPAPAAPTTTMSAIPEAPKSVTTGGTTASGPFTQRDKTFTPYISQVDKPTETVQGQLKSLFDEGNPLMVQARNRAEAAAAGRGLQNSSLAVGASQLAQMNAAMPIAQQDAATYAQRAMQNAQTINDYRMAEMSYYQELGKLKEQGNINAYLTGLQAGYERDLAVLNGQITKDIHILDNANKLLEIAAQGDIEAKLMVQKYGFDAALSAQDNLQRLQQQAAQGDINSKLQLEQFNYDTLLKDQEAGLAIQLEDKRIQGQQNAILLEYQQRGILSEQEAQDAMERLNQQHVNTLEQIKAQAESTADVAAADRSAQLQGQYLTAVAARQSSASAEITQIYTTPKLSTTQQNTAVRNAYDRLDADLAALAAYYANSPLWPDGAAPQPGTPPPASTTPNTPAPTATTGGTTGLYAPPAETTPPKGVWDRLRYEYPK